MHYPIVRTGFGRSMRRFVCESQTKPCILGGVFIKGCLGLQANTDGDVICEALCYALASVSSVHVQSMIEQLQLKDGITDSGVFVQEARKSLGKQRLVHIVINLERQVPVLSEEEHMAIREKIAQLLCMPVSTISFLSCSGDGLTDCSCGAGVQAIVCITTQEEP